MKTVARTALGFVVAAAGATAVSLAAAPSAGAAPSVCPALPGQSSSTTSCSAESGPNGLALAITDNGGKASSTANNFAGPAAIALGPGATVTMTGERGGLAIGIAGPGAEVVVDGKNGPTCKGGPAFAGDFQTFKGCMS
ncbi:MULTISPECIES: DUF6764 family protein [Gordonia]|jgi:hypothetical protein|uniref:Protein kinase n=1 Tax=Gordonia alkanivorans CGMCC 6845 TaxID=1423140 RepID=W9DJ40_9ACTN|nr:MULTISPECIES: DUF6764 family protein [Gordonia]ETA08632.1 hypothetical protein V525_00600 [Gordonia alkanivorans CGMCC 6845]MDH3005292.1 hypothetical protein [Gordonia alkanivorans]MDH3010409.1 hypothetical protein [Gordonia alkanivorans]MDH3014704.1 hypothetical protein [Gordonia alkanivorans]MDH3019204.1 hypothetical protein [Gordonia alkanivorans]